jgi:hypothetical protein
MADDDAIPTDPVAAAFARLAVARHATAQWETRAQPPVTGAVRVIRSVCNVSLAIGLLSALGVSIFAFLQL